MLEAYVTEPMLDILRDWPLGTMVGILLIAVGLFLIFMLAWGIFYAADSWFRPRKKGQGIVRDKAFIPEHTETTLVYDFNLKMSMPHTRVIPDTWKVEVNVEGASDCLEVEKEFFESVKKDDFVLAEYAKGRLSNNLYLKSVSIM